MCEKSTDSIKSAHVLNAMWRFASLSIVGFCVACSDEPVELGVAHYDDNQARVCTATKRAGGGGAHDDEMSAAGIRFLVRTPSNYDRGIGHPLLVVYAAAGHSARASERFTGLTPIATAAGFIVAYIEHRRLSLDALNHLAQIPHAVAQKWCVDEARIFVTGHSDGGTAAAAMAFRSNDGFSPRGIAPSAAGIKRSDLEDYDCPAPLHVLLLQNADDALFPGFAGEAAQWWASCMQCAPETTPSDAVGCVGYNDCAAGSAVTFCESDGGHRAWPDRNKFIVNLFGAIEL